jgi:hypothetical protein
VKSEDGFKIPLSKRQKVVEECKKVEPLNNALSLICDSYDSSDEEEAEK